MKSLMRSYHFINSQNTSKNRNTVFSKPFYSKVKVINYIFWQSLQVHTASEDDRTYGWQLNA